MKTAESVLTREELFEMESKPKSRLQKQIDWLIRLGPIIAGIVLLLVYYKMPNYGTNTITNVYPIFIGILISLCMIGLVGSIFSKKIFYFYRYKAPFYTSIFVVMMFWDYATLKTGILTLPYFPWIDRVLNAMIGDRVLLLECVRNSLFLLFTGYFF